MYKENETHREYEIEEFIFDDCIKEQMKELLGRYRSDFLANKDGNFFVRDLTIEFRGIPLFEELKYAYALLPALYDAKVTSFPLKFPSNDNGPYIFIFSLQPSKTPVPNSGDFEFK